jgi:hypothetical protein
MKYSKLKNIGARCGYWNDKYTLLAPPYIENGICLLHPLATTYFLFKLKKNKLILIKVALINIL